MGAKGVQGAPLGAFNRGWGGRRWGGDGERRRLGLGYGGGVVPVGFGRGGEVGELRGAKAELLAGLIWAERLWRRGSTAGLWLAGVRWSGGGGLWRLGRERARE